MRRDAASVAAAMLTLASLSAEAADRPVPLVAAPESDRPALPPIAAPVDAAENRINAELRRIDASLIPDADECLKGGLDRAGSWERSIDTSMRGPRFLGYAVTDAYDCGGAHPSTMTWSIVFDLVSGAPVDWTTLLPPALTGTVSLETVAGDIKVVTLASKRLHDLYVKHYLSADDDRSENCLPRVSETKDGKPRAMMVWPDARHGGLALIYNPARVVQACAKTVVIPTSVLREEGAASALTDAIDAAHAAQ